MKTFILGSILFFFMAICGCISTVSKADLPEYRAGVAYGDAAALQDAMHDPCYHRFPGFSPQMITYLHRHMKAMEGQRSPAFLKGFDHGYTREFFGYMNFYCGE